MYKQYGLKNRTLNICVEDLDTILYLDELRTMNLYNKINNHTVQLINNSNQFAIVHPCSRIPGKIQISFFYKNEPCSDIVRDNYYKIAEELMQYRSYKISEVI
jgi:hypothetical protein